MQINCIAIDDEPLALDKIVSFIEKIDYLNLTKTFDNAFEAIGYLKTNDTDLIFLDIQMDDFTGIQLLETIKNPPKVILTTAYDTYALKGYELGVNDYLLKPFSFSRFGQAVEKIYNLLQNKNQTTKISQNHSDNKKTTKESIFIKDGYKIVKIKLNEILFVKGMKDYLMIRTFNEKIHTLLSFKEIEEYLESKNFIRVHKSFIVAIDKIDSIRKNIISINKELIPIGKTFKKDFFDRIEIFNS